jgi:lysophosphatidic acid acyltransferase/lysophosphatidylinositol acyltransferase
VIPWVIDNWSRAELRIYGVDEELETASLANVIAILNHRGDVDWMLGFSVCDRFGFLLNVKCLMKSFVKYLPTLGWSFWFSDYAFLKRTFDQDHAHLIESTKQWISYQFPWTICLFSEGTRFTEEKHKKSLEYARKQGLPQLKHLLLPRTKGFNVMIRQLKDHGNGCHTLYVISPQGET